jgi:Fe-S-cluster containining protein
LAFEAVRGGVVSPICFVKTIQPESCSLSGKDFHSLVLVPVWTLAQFMAQERVSTRSDLTMKPWAAVDDDLVVRVKNMVLEALSAARSLEMALEVTRQTMQWADQLIEAFESANPLPRPVACVPGCTYCCHNQVEVTPAEVLLIARVMGQYFPPQKQASLKEKILRISAFKVGKSKRELASARQSQPCPLLAEDRCVVYPWRPLMCRAMHSLDQEHCRASFSAGDLSGDEYYLHRYVFPMSLSAGLAAGFREVGCITPVLELTQALGQVLLEPWLAERWLAGENIFPGLKS